MTAVARALFMLGVVACAFACAACECANETTCTEASCPRPSTCRAGVCVPPADTGADVGEAAADAAESSDAFVVGADAITVADSGTPRLICDACETDAQCGPTAVCVRLVVGGAACMPVCDPDLPDCPRAFTCVNDFGSGTMAPHCAPVGGACCVDEDDDRHGQGVGCDGIDCADDDPGRHAAAAEDCDGLDDDCDELTDEALGALSCGVGACATTAPACVGGMDGTCTPLAGTDESCNGLDDDCDGSTDEELGNLTCGTGRCAATAPACLDGTAGSCTPSTPAPETCNGLDDDCDAATDEALAVLTCGVGACASSAPACTGGMAGTCVPGAPALETCNAIDDDCDRATDEALGTITCGVGGCAATAPACVAGAAGTCTPGAPGMETCNGIDDDCDRATDEALGTITCGRGACLATAPACVGGMAGPCTPGPSAAESCNGIDDDCDGSTDEPTTVLCPGGRCAAGSCVLARSCQELLALHPSTASGLHTIDPDGGGALSVYCDMTTDDGGWTLLGRGVWYSAYDDNLPPGSNALLTDATRTRVLAVTGRMFRLGSGAQRLFIEDSGTEFGPGPVGRHFWRTSAPTVRCTTDYAQVLGGTMASTSEHAVNCDAQGIGSHTCGFGNGWILWHTSDTYNFSGAHPCAFGTGGGPTGYSLTDLWVR